MSFKSRVCVCVCDHREELLARFGDSRKQMFNSSYGALTGAAAAVAAFRMTKENLRRQKTIRSTRTTPAATPTIHSIIIQYGRGGICETSCVNNFNGSFGEFRPAARNGPARGAPVSERQNSTRNSEYPTYTVIVALLRYIQAYH